VNIKKQNKKQQQQTNKINIVVKRPTCENIKIRSLSSLLLNIAKTLSFLSLNRNRNALLRQRRIISMVGIFHFGLDSK